MISSGFQTQLSHLALDVRRRTHRVRSACFATAERVIGVDVKARHEVARSDGRDRLIAVVLERHGSARLHRRAGLLRRECGRSHKERHGQSCGASRNEALAH